jgi:Holliday junction resolvasome RuvABC ATP-dependent DNA helicase subunit
LVGTRRPIGEIAFDQTALTPLVEAYLSEYSQWLASGDEDATWFDTVAVHAAAPNDQVGGFLAFPEPSVMLLSPLHPLRLGWHCCAQQALVDGLAKTCPAAGLLDSNGCPDIGLWLVHQGHDVAVPRAFLSVACEEPHWSVLLNRTYVGQPQIDLALSRLAALGLRTRGLPGGFSRSQAFDSVEEVAKLMPGRATLRVGLVGDRDETSACAKGVWSWCAINCDEDQDQTVAPSSVEVFDMRRSTEPTAEQLATLAEETSERVRWFRVTQLPADSPQDLVLLDQLGADAPGGDKGASRTPTGPAALVRIRTREDSRNAMQLKESRIGCLEPTNNLPGLVSSLCIDFENLALRDSDTSHFTFRPVQQAIGSRLTQATYVAVTSTQIDPACIIRGTRSQQGYLWNYELPGALSGDEERAGYYLIASPMDAMLRAISQSAQLVAPTPPPVRDLLDEISRRGIPILKRLAAGGSQSRGELGLLLAVRFLQDAFRSGAARVGLPVWRGRCLHLILAVDPYETSFDGLRKALRLQTSEQRPDLLVFAIRLPEAEEKIRIKITPVEVKFRQGQMPLADIREALTQASNLGILLDELWVKTAPSNLWAVCSSGLLGQMLELAFRIYADPAVHGNSPEAWTRAQETVISAVLNQKAEITVSAKGRLLVFDQSPQTATMDADADSRFDAAVICRQDASILLAGSGTLSAPAEQSILLLDFSFPDCGEMANGDTSPSGGPAATPSSAIATPSTPPPTVTPATAPPAHPHPELPPPPPIADVPAPTDTEAPAQTVGTSPVPPEVRQVVRQAFQGFIGNEAAVRRIENDLLRALIDRPPHLSKNFLFTGQPSTGKTEISRRMAHALQLPFVKLDGRGLRSRERLFELIDGELAQQTIGAAQVGTQAGMPTLQYPALIVFIDEVHLVPRPIQESLLTMLEAADRSVTLADRVALMSRATFLFATTRASDVDAAFRSRCSEVQLKEYSREQVAEIVRLRFPDVWPESVYLAIAQLGRRVPRIALELARELETAITVAEDPGRTVQQHLDDVRRARELDELGLTLTDLEYLSNLARENRPVGEQTLLNMLGTVDRDRIVDEIEPFLRSLGFIRFGPRGREITPEGRDYLMDRTRHGRPT